MIDIAPTDPSSALLLLLAAGAFLAGFVDAVVGGGGLIQIPLLFAAFPDSAPAILFGTNKLASVVGTSSAALQYARRVPINWAIAAPAAGTAFVASWFGARSVTLFPPELLRPLVLVLLVAVAGYTFAKKEFGRSARGCRWGDAGQASIAIGIGAVIGFYDGFFGPGTGSFLIFCFVRFLGLDFLGASVIAKIANVATNLAAILFFVSHGSVIWIAAALMACCNLAGAILGSRLALRRGSAFVRSLFLVVVSLLIVKLAWDTIS